MSEPNFRIHIPFNDPNITSAVPGEQRLRVAAPKSDFTEVSEGCEIDDASNIVGNSREQEIVDGTRKKGDLSTQAPKEDYVLTPVMTITKEEAVFTKGDLKLQKVSVTEDISGTGVMTTVEQDVYHINNGEPYIRTEVVSMQQFGTETPTDEKDESEVRKPKTRIPTLRFRQAVDQLKQDRKGFEDKKEPETPHRTPRRSSIPRLRDSKISASNIKDITSPKSETTDALPRLSTEFDKLYDEIAENQDSLDNLSISSRIEDPVKVENTFEEILHAYEEIQPINVEKVRQSKIPLLKRKSEHDIEVPKHITSTVQQSVSVDLGKTKTSETITQNHSKIHSVTLNKSPVRSSLISQTISGIKPIPDSFTVPSNKHTESNIIKQEVSEEVINKTSKVNNERENVIETEKTETNLVHTYERNKSSINVDINEKIICEAKSVNKTEKENSFTQTENKRVHSVTSTNTSIEETYNDSLKNVSTTKYTDKSLSENVLPEKNEEDIPILKGKVNRIIKRMDSKDTEIKPSKPDFEDETPKEKSVLSKIAIFEHPNAADVDSKSINLINIQTSNIKAVEPSKTTYDLSNDKPKIIAEVLKALPARVIEVNNDTDDINDICKSKTNDNTSNSQTTKFDPKDDNHTSYTEIIVVQPQTASLSAEPIDTKGYNNDENINPVINVHPENRIPTLDVNGTRKVTQEIDLSERGTQWDEKRNLFDDKQHSLIYYKDLNVNEPKNTNGRPEIISDIIKQEVKFKHRKMDDQMKINEYKKSYRKARKDEEQLRIHSYRNNDTDKKLKSKSLADLNLDNAIKGRVQNIIVRMTSLDMLDTGKKEIIDIKERPRKRSVSEKIALFERKLTPIKLDKDGWKIGPKAVTEKLCLTEEEYATKIEELSLAKSKYGVLDPEKMKYLELRDGGKMPSIGIGTALLDPKLTRYVVQSAIDLGYRTIDTAYIYGNEKEVGEAINEKIKDGTVLRSELFIISKLWSTFHRQDLVQRACRASLDAMGLDYFDLYLIHNPMSFKEGSDPVPKIANVLQFSQHDYLDAWFGIEKLIRDGLVRRGGLSNFNSHQVDRVVEKGKIKPVINQVECHPYLSQHRLEDFCQLRNVKLCCYGVLGSKGTPQEHKSALPPAIDDPLVRVMAAGLDVSPAALLISYQLALDRSVVVKGSSAAHLWDNLQAMMFTPSSTDVAALHALNRNKRTFTFKGMGDTHRNYPFKIPF